MTNPAIRRIAAAGALMCATLSTPGLAQLKGPITLDQFVDRKSSSVRISGRSIVGATVDGPGLPTTTPALYVPAERLQDRKDICVESTTIDGTYWSRGQVRSDDVIANQGALQFRYGSDKIRDGESNYREAVNKFHGDGLAVLATMRACDGTGSGDHFVVVNRSGQPGAGRVDVYVNTARADAELTYKSRTRGTVSVPCATVKSDFQRVAYDAICSMSGPFEPEMEMALVLSRFGSRQDPLAFWLLLAPPTVRP